MLWFRIALLRTAKSWSQAELGRQLGISASAVGMYEQGCREPSPATVVSLARIFGVTTDYLLTGETRNAWESEPVTIRVEARIHHMIQTGKAPDIVSGAFALLFLAFFLGLW